MSVSKQRIITVRVSEDVHRRFRALCRKNRRSMSKQGELLIESFLCGDEQHEPPRGLMTVSDRIKQKMERIP
jgi:hypothetical protein